MRLLAVLASLAVATTAASLPASFVTMVGESSPAFTTGDDSDDERGRAQGDDSRSEPEEDDDLDDVDELVAVLDRETAAFVHSVGDAAGPVHEPRCPRAPHPEDTLRPPIA